MNNQTKAVFNSVANELIIRLVSGEVIKKTFKNKSLFSANKAEKIDILKPYILGFLKLRNVSLRIK